MSRGSRAQRIGAPVVALCLALGFGAGCGADSGSKGSSASKGSAEADPAGGTPGAGSSEPPKPEGPLHEPTKGPGGSQVSVLTNLPGTTSAQCVPVGKQRDVRSGDMGAGPFDTARAKYSPKSKTSRRVELYFIPTHSAKLKGITVTGKHASSGATLTKKSTRVSDADQWKFYQVRLDVPDAGTWTFRAATGQDKGCWIVDLA